MPSWRSWGTGAASGHTPIFERGAVGPPESRLHLQAFIRNRAARLKIPGLNIQVQEISYDDELEIEEVYGSGSKPRGYGTGNYKASGKLSMLRDDYDDLLVYCKQKGVPFYKMELPSIIVSYANEGARTKIDELKKVKFSKRSN